LHDYFKSILEFRLPDDLDDVPSNRSGVYVLCLRFPSDYELGLTSGHSDLERVVAVIRRYVMRMSKVIGFQEMYGTVRIGGVADHLCQESKASIVRKDLSPTSDLFESYVIQNAGDRSKVQELAMALRLGVSAAPPLYVGMTAKQSFQARIGQHFRGETDINERLSCFGLDWSMLSVKCISIENTSSDNVRQLEKIIQALLKPKLSKQ